MTQKLRFPAAILRVLCVALLIVSLVWSWTNLYTVSHNLLDADTSSELVLANLLAEEGSPVLSSNWIYSTELRVLNNQLVFAPLFHLFSDWATVRFVGVVILHLLFLGAYGFLARQARMSFNSWCVTASALILPRSIIYGRIVLYHVYYLPHIALGFLLTGLYLSVLDRACWTGSRRTWAIVRTAIMAVLAFVAGLGGVRMLMVNAFPLLASAVLLAIRHTRPETDEATLWSRLHGVLLAAALFVGCGAGYLVNVNVLAKIYSFGDYTQMTLMMPDFNTLNQVLNAFLEQYGYMDGSRMFSVEGVVSLGAVVMPLLALILGVHTLRHSADEKARFVQMMALMSIATMFVVFLLVYGEYVYTLYLLPVTAWVLPALGKADVSVSEGSDRSLSLPLRLLGANAPRLSVTKLVATVAVLPLILSGFYTSAFFRAPEASGREYAGLNYNETDDVARLTPVADFLRENGYTLGYASHWNAAIVTELTDGQARVTPIEIGENPDDLHYHDWLSDLRLRDESYIAAQKVFLLLNLSEDYSFDATGVLYERAEKVFDSSAFAVYTFSDPLTVHQYLTGALSNSPVYEEDDW